MPLPTGRGFALLGLAVGTYEGWLEEHRYLNMDLLAEHKREQLRQLEEAA